MTAVNVGAAEHRPIGLYTATSIVIANMIVDIPVNFQNQVVPVFTKFGCNAGGCHGKASGQNGFKLSLLGFDPRFDYDAIVQEGRGRRLFPSGAAIAGSSGPPHVFFRPAVQKVSRSALLRVRGARVAKTDPNSTPRTPRTAET